jgi:hypothetical protein
MSTGNKHPTMADSQKLQAQPKTGGAGAHSLHQLVGRIDELEARIARLENPKVGYRCKMCGINRPANWFIYEVEKSTDNWVTPCCAECAHKYKSRGPFPSNEKS